MPTSINNFGWFHSVANSLLLLLLIGHWMSQAEGACQLCPFNDCPNLSATMPTAFDCTYFDQFHLAYISTNCSICEKNMLGSFCAWLKVVSEQNQASGCSSSVVPKPCPDQCSIMAACVDTPIWDCSNSWYAAPYTSCQPIQFTPFGRAPLYNGTNSMTSATAGGILTALSSSSAGNILLSTTPISIQFSSNDQAWFGGTILPSSSTGSSDSTTPTDSSTGSDGGGSLGSTAGGSSGGGGDGGGAISSTGDSGVATSSTGANSVDSSSGGSDATSTGSSSDTSSTGSSITPPPSTDPTPVAGCMICKTTACHAIMDSASNAFVIPTTDTAYFQVPYSDTTCHGVSRFTNLLSFASTTDSTARTNMQEVLCDLLGQQSNLMITANCQITPTNMCLKTCNYLATQLYLPAALDCTDSTNIIGPSSNCLESKSALVRDWNGATGTVADSSSTGTSGNDSTLIGPGGSELSSEISTSSTFSHPGALAGLILGLIAFVAAALAVAFILYRQYQRRITTKEQEVADTEAGRKISVEGKKYDANEKPAEAIPEAETVQSTPVPSRPHTPDLTKQGSLSKVHLTPINLGSPRTASITTQLGQEANTLNAASALASPSGVVLSSPPPHRLPPPLPLAYTSRQPSPGLTPRGAHPSVPSEPSASSTLASPTGGLGSPGAAGLASPSIAAVHDGESTIPQFVVTSPFYAPSPSPSPPAEGSSSLYPPQTSPLHMPSNYPDPSSTAGNLHQRRGSLGATQAHAAGSTSRPIQSTHPWPPPSTSQPKTK